MSSGAQKGKYVKSDPRADPKQVTNLLGDHLLPSVLPSATADHVSGFFG